MWSLAFPMTESQGVCNALAEAQGVCNALPNSDLIRSRCRARREQAHPKHSMYADGERVLRGRALLDPSLAQHTSAVRTAGFFSAEDIATVRAAAAAHCATYPGALEDREAPLYLQRGGLPPSLLPLRDKIFAHACRVDDEHWGLAPERRRGRVHARCVEYHEYSAARRTCCGCHYDSGSLWTVDIMLSDTADFQGGHLLTTVRTPLERPGDGGEQRQPPAATQQKHTRHRFEQGDCLVFLSHKWHSVTPLRSGVRNVFVLEFWEGPACVCDHRCMGTPPCGDGYESGGSSSSSSASGDD